jgi:hypothetical protein
MPDQSQFSRVSKKQLFFIAEKLISEDFPTDTPYHDYSDAYNKVENIGKYFNISVVDEDVQFFVKFLDINSDLLEEIIETGDKSLVNGFEIPVAKTYELQYSVWGSCTYNEYLGQHFDSYDKDWVMDSATQQRDDGNWDFYNGYEISPTDYENFDETDYSYDRVTEDNDDDSKLSESLLDKLVLENTQGVIKSLDKSTLLKLRTLINSRLSSL